ncbi:hypothetical protein AAMO2058_000474800 [Amorphochlora amoebiformis]|uniref:Uncharacterized protein n=1 Tax=Amorphochlora amoebiformis TaxID=1561963 RepID=A0A7S0D8S9_9EUKA|mmetsp:Transcript_20217/g.32073  ORF Transcript_20217/g.32073 Transcript_20217/m.32073 type:complete len:217 (+) Transcript_20217:29-679(+)
MAHPTPSKRFELGIAVLLVVVAMCEGKSSGSRRAPFAGLKSKPRIGGQGARRFNEGDGSGEYGGSEIRFAAQVMDASRENWEMFSRGLPVPFKSEAVAKGTRPRRVTFRPHDKFNANATLHRIKESSNGHSGDENKLTRARSTQPLQPVMYSHSPILYTETPQDEDNNSDGEYVIADISPPTHLMDDSSVSIDGVHNVLERVRGMYVQVVEFKDEL